MMRHICNHVTVSRFLACCWWIGRHTSWSTQQSFDTLVGRHTSWSTHQSFDTPVGRHTNHSTHQLVDTPVGRHTSWSTHQLVHTPVGPHTSLSTHQWLWNDWCVEDLFMWEADVCGMTHSVCGRLVHVCHVTRSCVWHGPYMKLEIKRPILTRFNPVPDSSPRAKNTNEIWAGWNY